MTESVLVRALSDKAPEIIIVGLFLAVFLTSLRIILSHNTSQFQSNQEMINKHLEMLMSVVKRLESVINKNTEALTKVDRTLEGCQRRR